MARATPVDRVCRRVNKRHRIWVFLVVTVAESAGEDVAL